MSERHVPDLTVPARFRDALVAAQGDQARQWFDDLPRLVGELLERWSCAVTGPVMSGWAGIVLPVRRADGSRAVLKVSCPGETTRFEAITLAAWSGRGAVLVLECDDANFAMLLEEIGPDSLAAVADADEAMTVIGRLARRLAVPAPAELPQLQPFLLQLVDDLPTMSAATGHPLPARVVDTAVATCAELGPDQPETVQHGDLSESNVLRGTREDWLAIDPQGYAGEIAFECLTHLRERWTELRAMPHPGRLLRRRIAIFADAAEIDVERALRWTQARAVQTNLRSGGATDDDGVHEWIAATLTD